MAMLGTSGVSFGAGRQPILEPSQTTGELADSCLTGGGQSFTAGTKVLLAGGTAVPIASLKPGDKVLATNTKTGKTSAEPVTAVLVHHDTDRYNLTVRTPGGSTVIDTTSGHLFWDQDTRRWVKAGALKQGTHLRAADGSNVAVLGGYAPADAGGWMWDLSVPGDNDHDFYVRTVNSVVLVHNCPAADSSGEDGLTASQQRAVRSLRQQIAEHQAKLGAYQADPDAYDNLGYLKNAPTEEIRQQIIEGKIQHLQNEINAFQGQINRILGR